MENKLDTLRCREKNSRKMGFSITSRPARGEGEKRAAEVKELVQGRENGAPRRGARQGALRGAKSSSGRGPRTKAVKRLPRLADGLAKRSGCPRHFLLFFDSTQLFLSRVCR